MKTPRGFTLVELVVVIIVLGVMAALAIPRFIDVSQAARVASVHALAGAIRSTSENVRVMCKLDTACDDALVQQWITLGGKPAWLSYGYLEAGDNLNDNQIDAWIPYSGFTATLASHFETNFTLDGAPDPSRCLVSYGQAIAGSAPTIATIVSGC